MTQEAQQTSERSTVRKQPEKVASSPGSEHDAVNDFIYNEIVGAESIEKQATLLGRLQGVQRHAMVQRLSSSHGNVHVQRLTQAMAPPPPPVVAAPAPEAPAPSSAAPTASSSSSLPIQTKLTVNDPGDQYEREAEQMADDVMHMNAAAPPALPPEDNGDESPRSFPSVGPSSRTISRLPVRYDRGGEAPHEVEQDIQRMRGGGHALPDQERSFFENRMGVDFTKVRIHTNSTAVQLSRKLNAQAFTVGGDIAFGEGAYQPGTDKGRHLIAHELTHVIQQGAVQTLRRKSNAEVGVCPVCGKKGQGTCKGCGQRFVQRKSLGLGATIQRRKLESLSSVQASRFGQAVGEAEAAAPTILEQERTKQEEKQPEIKRPTGLPSQEERQRPSATKKETAPAPKTGAVPDIQQKQGRKGEPPKTEHAAPKGPVPGSGISTSVSEPATTEEEEGGGSWFSAIFNRVKQFASSLPTSDPGISTSAGPRPKVDTSGEADPAQMGDNQKRSDESVQTQLTDANQEVQKDFGENDIYPEVPSEMLKSKQALAPIDFKAGEMLKVQALQAEAEAKFNEGATPLLQGEIAPKLAEHGQERTHYLTESEKARTEGLADIEKETAQVRQDQQGIQGKARTEVDGERERWREENARVKEDYATKATDKRKELDKQVQDEVTTAEKEADAQLTAAEKDAESERIKAEKEAAAKKKEVEEKPQSAWEKLKGAVSSFFDQIKSAINKIFEGLRNLVKTIIETAKKVVNKLIDMARDAIVGFIKQFGEFLKTLISVALAAFPDLAKKARKWIDDRVNEAVTAVNKAADKLKEVTNKILDGIGKAIDMVLAAYQKLYNMILDGLKFLAVGLLEVMERLGNLVKAGMQMPDHFLGQLMEEVLGMNLTEPLPFERSAEACQVGPESSVGQESSLMENNELASLMSKGELSESDVEVESVEPFDIEPELLASLNLSEGGEVEFGGSNDPANSKEAIFAELGGGEPALEGEGAPTTVPAEGEELQVGCDDEATAQAKLDQMMAQEVEGAEGTSKQGEPATQGAIPEEMRTIGPLTMMQRGQYMLHQMKQGVQKWFEANWPYVLAGGILGLAAFIGLNILTGGAITAALPPLMTVISAVMTGIAIGNVMKHIADYLSKGWGGDIAGAAKSLARGLAVGAIELVFALLFNAGAVIKALKGGLKGTVKAATKAVKNSVKTAIKSVRQLGQITRQGARTALKNGKLLFKGVNRGFAKGAKSLDELAQGLMQRLRFDRFKIKRQGWHIQLWGHTNPWVLLATGEVKHVDTVPKESRIFDDIMTDLGPAKLLDPGNKLPGAMKELIEGNAKKGKDQLFDLFNVQAGKKVNLDVPSSPDGGSYITYIFKNADGEVVYVGKASIRKGTPAEALKKRIQAGHDHFRPDLEAQVIAAQGSKDACAGSEEFFKQGYQKLGAELTNVDNALSMRSDRLKRTIEKIEAFYDELALSHSQ